MVQRPLSHVFHAVERIESRKGLLAEGMEIARILPVRQCRMVGAWCFLDHLGPIAFAPQQGMHVGAHPHTRLQTFTWMMEGEILHRDSLGSEQVIRPGQVNLMTAGRGIAHTEDSVTPGARLHAAQLWIALPDTVAQQSPAFVHHAKVPQWREQGCAWSLMAGSYRGHKAPAQLFSPLLGLEVLAPAACNTLISLTLELEPAFEYGLVALEGGFTLDAQSFAQDVMAYLAPGRQAVHVQLQAGSRLLVIGGQPFTERVTMWWNFLGPDMASIRRYREQWMSGDACFGDVPGAQGQRLAAPALP